MLVTVIPEPALTLELLAKPVPSMVTATVDPSSPWLGVSAVTVTPAVVTVVATAEVPSEKVAVTVSIRPPAKPWPPL